MYYTTMPHTQVGHDNHRGNSSTQPVSFFPPRTKQTQPPLLRELRIQGSIAAFEKAMTGSQEEELLINAVPVHVADARARGGLRVH